MTPRDHAVVWTLLIVLLAAIFSWVGLYYDAARYSRPTSVQQEQPAQRQEVLYYHDSTRGVGCWATTTGQGMFCIPDREYIVTETAGMLRDRNKEEK